MKKQNTKHAAGPRLLTRTAAAKYCSLSEQGFSSWVRAGRLPAPILGTNRWDIVAIDAALDRLSQIDSNVEKNEFDQWKAVHNARSS